MNYCQWVVGAHRAGALTLAAKLAVSFQPSARTSHFEWSSPGQGDKRCRGLYTPI
jgi:hypothetical protein